MKFSSPDKNVAQLGLKEGMRVADFGAGSGAYSIAASRRVGITGIVYAIEVQKNLIKKLESEVKEVRALNIKCIWGNIEKKGGTKIADHSMDAVIIANVLFLAEDKVGVIDEAKRLLKKGGKVLFVDWLAVGNIDSPEPGHIINPKLAESLFVKRGFKMLEKISTSSHHYGIIFIHE